MLTQLLTYQQYQIFLSTERELAEDEANSISDRLTTSLASSLSATKTLAFIIENYGMPDDFEFVASAIMRNNQFIDAIELTREGVITHVYPMQGNEQVIGYDVLADETRNAEAKTALEKRSLFFAGPFELRQGGMAVVGRLPIFKGDQFWGFSAVIIRLNTWLRAAGIDSVASDRFHYQLSKINPSTGNEEFFLDGGRPKEASYVSVDVPSGAWRVYVMSKEGTLFLNQVVPFSLLGTLLSITAGVFAWHFTRQPEALKRRVQQIASAMQNLQRQSTASLQHANRLYHFISRINHLMVHAKNEETLFQEVCRIAFDVGGYKLAWIGTIDDSQTILTPSYSAGDDKGYLSTVTNVQLNGEGDSPAKRMVRTGVHVYCNDTSSEQLMKPWAALAAEKGFRSVIIMPVCCAGKIIASFNLYSGVTNAFHEEEIKLLLETTSNISFTLDSLNNERLRKNAEALIQEEKILSDSIINSLPGIFYLCNEHGKFIRWNRNMEHVSGLTADEMLQVHQLDFFRGSAKELLREKINEVFEVGHADVTADFVGRNRDVTPYYFNGRKVQLNGQDFLIGMGLDISERVKAEQALVERAEEIERLSLHLQNIREEERSRIALEIHDVLGQQLTALKMDASWVTKRSTGNTDVHDRLTTMMLLIDDTIKTIRRISSELRPGILDDLGLIAALEWQGSEFEKNTGVRFIFETNVQDVALDQRFAINVFRIFQEALTNITRHAEATTTIVKFSQEDDNIELTITDNGKGIDLVALKKKSLGLVSMKERARQLKGEVSIENVSPSGTVVRLSIPCPK